MSDIMTLVYYVLWAILMTIWAHGIFGKVKTEPRKYKLTKESIEWNGHTLYRIKCTSKRMYNVKKGELGGFIESEENLSHSGDCWIHDNAKVYGHGVVEDDARVADRAEVYDCATVCGNARLWCNSKACEGAEVEGIMRDDSVACRSAYIPSNTILCGNSLIMLGTPLPNNLVIHGGKITSFKDFIVIHNAWSSGRNFLYTIRNNMWHVGCFYGTSEQLITKAYSEGELKGKCYESCVEFVNKILEHRGIKVPKIDLSADLDNFDRDELDSLEGKA